jgi:predicted PurR-regulated permease PerM
MDQNSESIQKSWTFQKVFGATLILVFIALSFLFINRFYQVIFILLIGILAGTVIRPVSDWFTRHGVSQVMGVFIVYLVLFLFLIIFILLLLPLVIEQGSAIASSIPGYYQNFLAWMENNSNQIILWFHTFLPEELPALNTFQQTDEQLLVSAGQAMNYLSSAVVGFFIALAILVIAFRWTIDGRKVIQTFLRLIPVGQREGISDLIEAMEIKVGNYIAGQGFLSLAIGVLALVAYLAIGLPNALLLALVAGVFEVVPMIGPLLGAIPAALIALTISPAKLIWVIVATLVIQQLENSILVPRVMRKAVGVNPFVSLLAIFAFSSLFGIAGTLMAIPLAAIFQLILNRFVFRPEVTESELSFGRDHASLLRYEAQDLVRDLRKQARLKKWGSDREVKHIDSIMDEIESITTDLDVLLAEAEIKEIP